MADLQARAIQKAVLGTLTGLGDAEIPAALARAARLLREAGISSDPEPAKEPEPKLTRTLRYGPDRMQRSGKDRT